MPGLVPSSAALAIPKIRVDIAQREAGAEESRRAKQRLVSSENWAGGRLSARGLDALQSIRDAAQQHLNLRQDSGAGSPSSIPESPSPTSPRSRTRRKSTRNRAALSKSPQRSPRPPLVHYRRADEESEQSTASNVLTSTLLPSPPNRIRGLPARSLRFQRKTPEPPIPMYTTSETEGACLDRHHTSLTPRERQESPGRRHLGGYVDVQKYQTQKMGPQTHRREESVFSMRKAGIRDISESKSVFQGEVLGSEATPNVRTISFPCETSGMSVRTC